MKILGFALISAIFLVACAGKTSKTVAGNPEAPTPVITALQKYERDDKARGPLGGEWNKGAETFSSANGATEARTLIARGKAVVLLSQGAAGTVVGVADNGIAKEIIRDRKVRKLGIPETGEIVTGADHKKYIEAATRFGQAFNNEMVKYLQEKRTEKR